MARSLPRRILCLMLITLIALPGGRLLAQPKPSGAVKSAGAKAPLDALDENKLMGEMANRGLTDLLDYYFQKNNVPDEKRKETVVLIALKHLDSPDFARKTMAERKDEIQKIVVGINAILPSINDPTRLLRYASGLITNGTMRLVNTLEYWGENPRTQAALNPIAETVDKILAQAVSQSKVKADAIVNAIKGPNDPNLAKWEEANQLMLLAEYTKARAGYGLALSYDKAAVDQRGKVCSAAIEKLKDFDVEGGDVRIASVLAIAKLSMAMGGPEGYKQAKEYFAKVVDAKSDDAKAPDKYLAEQYEARYFNLVADLLAHKPAEAEKGVAALREWQDKTLPEGAKKGADAAMSMLEYRIDAGKAELASDPAQREKLNADAVAVLMDLVAKRPDLRPIIFEQVMGKIPEKPNLAELNPLLLEAIVTRGIDALQRKTPEKEDSRDIQMAADASRQIVKRRGQPGISAAQVDTSAYAIGIFEQRIGAAKDLAPEARRTNKADAVEAFIAYVKTFGANKVRTDSALENAMALLTELRKDNANDDRVNKLFDEALDVALFKGGRQELAYAYARRRMELQDYANARRAFGMVKSDNPTAQIMSRYYQMVSDQQLLIKAANDAERKSLSDEIQKLADQLNPMVDRAIAEAKDATAKREAQLTKVKMRLLAADVARANKAPARVIELLNGFEGQIEGFPAEKQNELVGNALFLRVNALIALGQNKEAIAEIQKLVAQQQPAQALVTITNLLTALDASFNQEKGKASPDAGTLQLLSAQRAQLASLLIDQVQKNPGMPDKNKRQYVSFNATAQRQAAELEPDANKKKAYLGEAIKTYQALLKDVPADDPEAASLQRLIALAQFQLGGKENLQLAHDTLNELFAAKKFGGAMVRIGDESKPNEIYWEGLLRWLQIKMQLATLNPDPSMRADAQRIMKNNVIIPFGDQAGGDAFAKDFRALRKEILGDWKPEAATQPVAGG